MFRTLVVALIVLSAATATRAQQANTAVVIGSVVDDTKGAIPGATVTLTQRETNAAITVVTDERGDYRTPPLRPGTYDVTVELPGFKRFTQQAVVLNIGDVRKVD